jgi:hypothetical protein
MGNWILSHCYPTRTDSRVTSGVALLVVRVVKGSLSQRAFRHGVCLDSATQYLMDRTVKTDECTDSSKRQGVEISKRPYMSSGG